MCMDYIRGLASTGFKMILITLVYLLTVPYDICLCIQHIGKRERIDFAQTVTKYDRRFKVSDNVSVRDCVGYFVILNLYRLKRGTCCCLLRTYT